jgi:hypothetical protein
MFVHVHVQVHVCYLCYVFIRLLFICLYVCCLLFVVCCLLFVVCVFVVCCLGLCLCLCGKRRGVKPISTTTKKTLPTPILHSVYVCYTNFLTFFFWKKKKKNIDLLQSSVLHMLDNLWKLSVVAVLSVCLPVLNLECMSRQKLVRAVLYLIVCQIE